MWHSKCMMTRCVLTSSLLARENDKNWAGSMAMWVAPIRVYNHLSREIPFVSYSIDSAHSGTVVWVQPLVIYIRYTQAKWVVGHVRAGLQDVLVEPSVLASRDTLSAGGPILCHSWNPISNKRPWFLFVYYICGAWDASVPLDCYLLVFRHYCNIRQDIGFKLFWVIVR